MALRFTTGTLIPVCIIVLGICAVNFASGEPGRRERHVSKEDSTSHRLQSSQSFDYPDGKSSTFKNNEFTTNPRRKVSQRLMGGHIRMDTKTEPPIASHQDNDDDDDDEATWDDGLILSSAGNGKEKKNSIRTDDDDEKKTLSQQVKEGKYGLIQNEIYPGKPKRPGIISYLSNPEVPKDNAKNLGGLDEDEIWLAENHVLVLRGGNFPDHDAERQNSGEKQEWPPIDDYKAPKRQVKIPPRPKIPPPFPVQLSENGPVQIIGVNGTADSNEDNRDSQFNKGYLPGEGPFFANTQNSTNTSQDLTSQENSTKKLGDDKSSVTQERKTKSGHVPPPPPPSGVIGPFYPAIPPGAVFVIPPGNLSEYDEDDQSIYYPPPYSFYYKQDNSTPVPPGPLVPGIILPPPPDFFSGQDEKKSTTKMQHIKYTKRPSTTPMPRVSPTYYPPRKSSTKNYKGTDSISSTVSTTKQTSRGTFTMKPVNRIKYKTTTERTTSKPIRVQEITSPFVEITTPATNKASNLEITEFYTVRPNSFVNQASEKTTTRTKSRWSQSVSSRPVPLVSYYSTSTASSVAAPVEATAASLNKITTGRQRATPNQASYYFYKEDNDDSTGTTPNPTIYYRATTESPYYRVQDTPEQNDEPKKPYYDVRVTPTQRTPKDFNLELLEPVPKTSSRYQYTNSAPVTNSVSSRTQGQRMLSDSAPVYYESITERPQTPLQPYYTTTKPRSFLREPQDDNRYDYDQGITPKPIYQYSFEAADYFKRGQERQQNYYKPESQQQSYYKQNIQQTTTPEPFDEWEDIRDENNSNQYDYEGSETLPEQQIQPERETTNHYRNRLPVSYPSSTGRPIINTTPNSQHVYYTKQDEQLLDDVTKEYFTNFGKKLRGESLSNTTPLYGKTGSVTDRPDYTEVESYVSNDYDNERQTATYKPPRVRVHYGDQTQRPYSLEEDTQVNYKDPLPAANPDSEWIPGFNPKQQVNVPLQSYRNQQTQLQNQDYVQQNLAGQRLVPIRGYTGQRIIQQNGGPTNFVPLGDSREDDRRNYPVRPVSLAGDIAVNYRNPRPPINPDAEFINPGTIRDNGPDKASYFAYRLPGDGGHFYFLTPQAISQRQDENGGYLYSRPRGPRLSRRRRRGPGNA